MYSLTGSKTTQGINRVTRHWLPSRKMMYEWKKLGELCEAFKSIIEECGGPPIDQLY